MLGIMNVYIQIVFYLHSFFEQGEGFVLILSSFCEHINARSLELILHLTFYWYKCDSYVRGWFEVFWSASVIFWENSTNDKCWHQKDFLTARLLAFKLTRVNVYESLFMSPQVWDQCDLTAVPFIWGQHDHTASPQPSLSPPPLLCQISIQMIFLMVLKIRI